MVLGCDQEIDQLCDEWTPEPLHPPITKEMELSPPVLESAAGPHTVVNGKDVINLSSANYLGLIGHPKIKVPGIGVLNIFSALGFWLLW